MERCAPQWPTRVQVRRMGNMVKDVRVTFKGKAWTAEDGTRYVALVAPAAHHIDADSMMTVKAVGVAWSALFGHNGRVAANDPLVESFGEGFMPTVTVNLGDVRTAVRFDRKEFWEHVDRARAAGMGLLAAEDAAHEAMRDAVIASRVTV